MIKTRIKIKSHYLFFISFLLLLIACSPKQLSFKTDPNLLIYVQGDKDSSKFIVKKLESGELQISYLNKGGKLGFIAENGFLEDVPTKAVKTFTEKLVFRNNNNQVDITIESGQGFKPTVMNLKGKIDNVEFSIDSTKAFKEYITKYSIANPNIDYNRLTGAIRKKKKVEINLYIDFKGSDKSAKSGFLTFWNEFAYALLNYNKGKILENVDSPLTVNGPLDHFSPLSYDDKNVLIVLDEFFLQEIESYPEDAGFKDRFRQYIERDRLLLTNEFARIQDMSFIKKNGKWLLSYLYFEENTYNKMPKLIKTFRTAVVNFTGASFMPDLSMIHFIAKDGKKIDFYFRDTGIDINNNKFFDSIAKEGQTFPEFKSKPEALKALYKIYYYRYKRAAASGEAVSDYNKLQKYNKINK